MRARYFLGILLVMSCFIASMYVLPNQSYAQDNAQTAFVDSTSGAFGMENTKEDTTQQVKKAQPAFNQETLMTLYRNAGIIGTITLLVLAFGIFLIIRQTLDLKSDEKDSAWVIDKIFAINLDDKQNFDKLDQTISEIRGKLTEWKMYESRKITTLFKPLTDGINNFIYQIRNVFLGGSEQKRQTETAAKTTVFGLFSKLHEVYKATKDTDSFNAELANYVQYLKDKFNPFLAWQAYLSDTAGALGLLGTVWGMFLTFASGSMEQSEIISGMGIALATTIIGIVVSLAINTFTTMVSNKFDAHLELIAKTANNFQLALMRMSDGVKPPKTQVVQPPQPVVKPEPEKEKPEKKVEKPRPYVPRVPDVIEVLSQQNQRFPVNSELPEPLKVRIKDQDGIGMDGVPVTFAVDEDSGRLNSGHKSEIVKTSDGGFAAITWRLGSAAGKKMVRITADGIQHKTERFFAEAIPEKPSQIHELEGNFQNGRTNEPLRDPFVVRILDEFKNPVSGCIVNFSIKDGGGSFRNSKAGEISIETDDRGIAEAQFHLGNRRGSIKVQCAAKNVKDSIMFEAFAQ